MALRGKFQRPQNRPATIEYTEKGLSKLCCKTQRNLESPLFQAFFSTYVPEKAFSVCIKDSVFIDPACGTSGFLVSAGEYLKEHRKEDIFFNRQKKDHYMNHMFFGYDMDRTMLRIGAMNMMTHGIDNPFIEYRDSLSDQNPDKEKYSLILANPPFKGSLDADTVSADLLKVCKTKKTELLFLALFLRMLRIGGRCACIVPDGVLFGSSTAHKAIRKELVDSNRMEAVISMPSGVFKPYAGVSTAVLIFTKTSHGGTDNVWFYGNVCILGNDYDVYYLNQRNAKLELQDTINKYYLSMLLKFEPVKKKLTGISRGVRQANISNKDILNLMVPIPPIELQNQFAAFVEQIDKSKVAVQKALDEAQLLFDSLMQKYFG